MVYIIMLNDAEVSVLPHMSVITELYYGEYLYYAVTFIMWSLH
jgi:hypothetical protein